jgi:hypothetical protein
MKTWEQEKEMVTEAAKSFPATFGLRAFPGDTFRISLTSSYVSGETVYLYTEIRKGKAGSGGEKWLSFAKGTSRELKAELVTCSCGEGNDADLGHCDGCSMRVRS